MLSLSCGLLVVMAFSVWRLLSTDILPLLIHQLSIAFMAEPALLSR